jgi:hypothetical protein
VNNPFTTIAEYKDRLRWPEKVALEAAYPDEVIFRLLCSCGDREHDVTLWLERTEDMPHSLTLRVYAQSVPQYSYGADSLWERAYWFWRRLQKSISWLFSGYITMETETLIEGAGHIRSLRDALSDALEYLERPQEETNERRNDGRRQNR